MQMLQLAPDVVDHHLDDMCSRLLLEGEDEPPNSASQNDIVAEHALVECEHHSVELVIDRRQIVLLVLCFSVLFVRREREDYLSIRH